jgi:hypothetical protein
MKITGWLSRRLQIVVALLICSIPSWTGCHNECSRNSDCSGGSVRSCAMRETWCESGQCQVQCSKLCVTDVSDINSCSGGLICTDNGQQLPIPAHCTALSISCTVATDCPLYRPADDAGAQQDWTCSDGICSYPELNYAMGQQ